MIDRSWRDIDGSLLTPNSQSWKMYDPEDNVKEENTTPTLETEGVYYWDYTIGATEKSGTWKCIATAVKGTRNGVAKVTFVVEET